MTATDADALLAAVLAAPEDDAPRLIFADWLEERGDKASIARAAFIRAQVKLAGPDCPQPKCVPPESSYVTGLSAYTHHCRCPYCKLRRAEWYAWRKYGCEWQAEVIGPIVQSRVENVLAARAAAVNAANWIISPTACGFSRGFASSISLTCEDWMAHGPALVRAHPLTRVC